MHYVCKISQQREHEDSYNHRVYCLLGEDYSPSAKDVPATDLNLPLPFEKTPLLTCAAGLLSSPTSMGAVFW